MIVNTPSFVILAAGAATRFGGRPKVLQEICGRRILDIVLDIAGSDERVVVGSAAVAQKYGPGVILQDSPTGNGSAFLLGLERIQGSGPIVALMGDSPLVSREDIDLAITMLDRNDVVLGKFSTTNPRGYGRIVESGGACRVYEPSEAPAGDFFNAGWICFNRDFLREIRDVEFVGSEKRITDFVNLSKRSCAIEVSEANSIGVNSMGDYHKARREIQHRLMDRLFMGGVDFLDSCALRFDTRIGAGTVVQKGVVFGPNVVIGEGCALGPFCYLEECQIGDNCHIGPFSHIRGGSKIAAGCYIGSFCEVNRSSIGAKSKAKHFGYIGDGDIGVGVNIGAGTIFCNYNGRKKSVTKIADGAFLGGGCAYVAPVEVGEGSYIGAGTVVRKDVQPGTLCVDRRERIQKDKRNANDE